MPVLPDIPRLYTGLAEWAACLVYVLLLGESRAPRRSITPRIAAGLCVQGALQIAAGFFPLPLWGAGMALAVGAMYLFLYLAGGLRPRDAGYCCARAFIAAEFTASLHWQLYCYFFHARDDRVTGAGMGTLLAVYGLVFVALYFAEKRHLPREKPLYVLPKELWTAAGIALATFLVSNMSFVTANTPFSSRLIPELFYIRTLVDFCGLVILYTHQEQRRERELREELAAITGVLRRQFEHYRSSRESMDMVNRKYHDLKHQVAVIRAELDPAKQAGYLRQLEDGLQGFEALHQTGSPVLDTVLHTRAVFCAENGITLTCVADGALLNFMDVMDVCSVFGNALDNAVESVMKLPDPAQRLIRVALYAQNNFVILRVENFYDDSRPLTLIDGLPATTKHEHNPDGSPLHGFGLKSVRYVAEKYAGSMTINTEDAWFILRVLLPGTGRTLG